MTEIFKVRCDQLFAIGLRFNGQEYIGKDNYRDVNVHWTEITTMSDNEWNSMILSLKQIIEERSK